MPRQWRRRTLATSLAGLLVLLGGCGFVSPVAQKIIVSIGVLTLGPDHARQVEFEAAVRELGWVKGENLEFAYREHGGRTELVPALAEELVRLNVDLIPASSEFNAHASKQATSTIPIV